jgi:hypothetical protein
MGRYPTGAVDQSQIRQPPRLICGHDRLVETDKPWGDRWFGSFHDYRNLMRTSIAKLVRGLGDVKGFTRSLQKSRYGRERPPGRDARRGTALLQVNEDPTMGEFHKPAQ